VHTISSDSGPVVAVLLNRVIFVAVIKHRPVVAAEHDQRVVGKALLSKQLRQLAHAPVKLEDRIAAWPKLGEPLKPLVHNPGHMAFMRRKEQEEGLPWGARLMLRDACPAPLHPGIGQVFIAEAGSMAAGVEADAADAVVDRLVVAVRPVHLQARPLALAGGMIG
jgi:hypothetical protein